MEYVKVIFVRKRKVYVDGVQNGSTNIIIPIGPGTHSFDLGEPADYDPSEVIQRIKGTNVLDPFIIDFDEVPL